MNIEKIKEQTQKYLEALPSNYYSIRLVFHDKTNQDKQPIKRTFTGEQVLRSLSYFQMKNKEGYHVYIRPIGFQFVLLDDVTREMLHEVAKVNPSMIIETSPKNYQVWLHLPEKPESHEDAKNICAYAAEMFKADPKSAYPEQVGRAVGFFNVKEKYKSIEGNFPTVHLRKSALRHTTLSPPVCLSNPVPKPTKRNYKKQNQKDPSDQSRKDFNLACMLLRQKKSYEHIYQEIKKQFNSDKHKESDYIPRTIRNARKLVK